MSAVNYGGPAFPTNQQEDANFNVLQYASPGMNLRDYFAIKALQGWLASYGPDAAHPALNETHTDRLAEHSYTLADAMIKARAK